MKSLKEIYNNHTGFLLNKWENYIDIYDTYFSKYRNKKIRLLEIGVAHGGSLQMWREYFGAEAELIGVDVNPECKKFESANTKIWIGSQSDKNFLEKLKNEIKTVDILVDDGGHTMLQQNTTFQIMFDVVKADGIYVCEDLHTSYWKRYGGGFKKKNTFIESGKDLIDYLHGWHAEPKDQKKMFNQFTGSIKALHFYDSMLVIEKSKVEKPLNTFKGFKENQSHADYEAYELKLKQSFGSKINSVLKRIAKW